MIMNAQEWYQPSDINAGWRVWDSVDAFNWLIDNGQKVNISINPQIDYKDETGSLHLNPSLTEATCCFVRGNKLLGLTFSKKQGIKLHTEQNVYKLADIYTAIGDLVKQYWFKIDFEKIAYSPILDWLIIPCGYYAYTGYNAIVINFNETNALNDVYSGSSIGGDKKEQYYSIQGIPIDENQQGQIIIKTDGKNTIKYINH